MKSCPARPIISCHGALLPTHSTAALSTMSFTLRLGRGFSDLNDWLSLQAYPRCRSYRVQAREITHSRYPQVTAITTLAIFIPPFVLSFATLDHLTQRIAARTEPARARKTVHKLGNLLPIGLLARVLLLVINTIAGR
jgi:hypothetical protein